MANFQVKRDTREQDGWDFAASERCLGTIDGKLDTGDYSLVGLENRFTIERKRTTAELASNLTDDRFERELERMSKIEYAIIICEFDAFDLLHFPQNSTIPKHLWPKLRVTGNFLLKRIVDLRVKYKVDFIFAGVHGEEVALAFFKRMSKLLDE